VRKVRLGETDESWEAGLREAVSPDDRFAEAWLLSEEIWLLIGVPPRRVNEVVLGKRGITADTALRLGRFFGTTAEFWMNLQMRYDLETRRSGLGRRLDREVQVLDRRVA